MSQNTVHQIAVYLADNRKSNPLGYSTSDFISDVESVLPKRAKKKLRRAKRKVERTASDLIDSGQRTASDLIDSGQRKVERTASDLIDSGQRKVSDLIDSGQRKVSDYVDSMIDYEAPSAQDQMSQIAYEGANVSAEDLKAQKDADAQREKDEQEAAAKKARNIVIASVATIGGLTALYFVFKK